MRERARVNEALNRLTKRNEGADEDRDHDGEPSPPLTTSASEVERDPKRDGGQCVAEVVDQVCEQRDAQRSGVNERLRERSQRQQAEAP